MNSAHPDRRVLLSLLAAGGCAVAPHANELPLWVIAVFLACATWRYASEILAWYRPGRPLRFVLMLLVIVSMYKQFGTLLGRDPGMALLIGLMGVKLLELKTQRDYIVSLFVFYLIILGSFLYVQSFWVGVWALVAVTVSVMGLIHLMQPIGMNIGQRLRLSSIMLLKALPLMLIVYLLFPRISGTLWGLSADAHIGITGMPDRMQPGTINQLSESPEIAFRVNFDGKIPPQRELYWRGLVFTLTDGHDWERVPSWEPEQVSFGRLSEPVRYHVTLEPSNKPWMPVLDLPAIRPDKSFYHADFTLEYREPISERLNYTLVSYTDYRTGTLDGIERAHTLRLPRNVSERTKALAEQWRREYGDPVKVARAALDFFDREKFVYTLNPPQLGNDPVDEFLFTVRRGFCEHYASAFATLMRAAGIPSRVVVGYHGGEFNSVGNYLIVRQSDAHAWTEIWTAERGWMRVDPTGAIAPERIELGLDAVRRLELQGVELGSLATEAVLHAIELGWFEHITRQTRWYWDLTNLAWYRWVVDYGKERQSRFFSSLGLNDITWDRMVSLSFVGVLLTTLIYALFLLRTKTPVDPALALYLRFCRRLARAGIQRAPYEGALDFAHRCEVQRPDLKDGVNKVTALYLRVRYGKQMDVNELSTFKREVAKFRV